MKSLVRLAATASLAALFGGILGAMPASADDGYYGPDRNHVRIEVVDIHSDESRLCDLQRRRDWLAAHHRRDECARLDLQIDQLRFHIERDRRDVRFDINTVRRERDTAWRRDHDDRWRRDHDNAWRRDHRDYNSRYDHP